MSFTEGPPGFRGLEPLLPIRRHRRHLPHWVQAGATYFVTFHLADSLPAEKRREFAALQQAWELAHPQPTEAEQEEQDRQQLRRLQQWLDAGAGECPFADPAHAQLLHRALLHFQHQRYLLGCHCVMPNHVHVVVKPLPGHELSDVLKTWKGFTARELNRRRGRQGTFWEEESFDVIVRDAKHLAKVVRYVGDNPRLARLPAGRWLRWVEDGWARSGFGFGEA